MGNSIEIVISYFLMSQLGIKRIRTTYLVKLSITLLFMKSLRLRGFENFFSVIKILRKHRNTNYTNNVINFKEYPPSYKIVSIYISLKFLKFVSLLNYKFLNTSFPNEGIYMYIMFNIINSL